MSKDGLLFIIMCLVPCAAILIALGRLFVNLFNRNKGY